MLVEAAQRRDSAPSAPRATTGTRGTRRLAGAFAALVALTFGLLVLGALVRAHDAGLACPDWPLCFGELVPRMDLRVAFEWTHRAVAGTVALAFAALGTLLWRRSARGDGLRGALVLGAVLLGVQILLGALTVWRLLAPWTVTSHLLTGNAFAATLAWIALELRDRGRDTPPPPRAPSETRRWLALLLALLVLQMTLGGLVSSRYAGLACPEWPTCRDGLWLPTWQGAMGLHLAHRTNGYLLLAAALALAGRVRGGRRLLNLARLAAGLALAQVAVGVANVLTGIPVELTGLHSALAAALVLTGTAAAREAWSRRAARPGC